MEIYTIRKSENKFPLLAHIPHSSLSIPQNIRPSLLLDDIELGAELLKITDRYVDELFSCIYEHGGISIIFNYSRLVIDPERFEDDELEPMSRRGRGVIYTKTSDGKILRDDVGREDREKLLEKFFHPYHKAIEQEVQNLLNDFGQCLIIDCHSFPSIPLPFEPDQDPQRPDICIGTDPFHTLPSQVEAVKAFFKRFDLQIKLNKPYE